jgi:hypothetical protein
MMHQELFESIYQEEIYSLHPRTAVVLNSDWQDLGEGEKIQLSKILAAVKLSIPSVEIVTQPYLNIPFFKGRCNRLIYFGEVPAGVARYQVLEADGISFICSEELKHLIANPPARKQLWTAMQPLFLNMVPRS